MTASHPSRTVDHSLHDFSWAIRWNHPKHCTPLLRAARCTHELDTFLFTLDTGRRGIPYSHMGNKATILHRMFHFYFLTRNQHWRHRGTGGPFYSTNSLPPEHHLTISPFLNDTAGVDCFVLSFIRHVQICKFTHSYTSAESTCHLWNIPNTVFILSHRYQSTQKSIDQQDRIMLADRWLDWNSILPIIEWMGFGYTNYFGLS